MLAAVLHDGAPPPTVEDVPAPKPEPGQLFVTVLAAALNPVDLLVAAGGDPTINPARPYVPGFEGVGRVVGDSTSAGRGRRIWWLGGTGSLAGRAVTDAEDAVDVPDALSDAEAAAIGVAGIAAWLALVERAKLQPGERVLVLGASGAVGRFAVQIARALGAERGVAAARCRPDGLHITGAESFVSLREQQGL